MWSLFLISVAVYNTSVFTIFCPVFEGAKMESINLNCLKSMGTFLYLPNDVLPVFICVLQKKHSERPLQSLAFLRSLVADSTQLLSTFKSIGFIANGWNKCKARTSFTVFSHGLSSLGKSFNAFKQERCSVKENTL